MNALSFISRSRSASRSAAQDRERNSSASSQGPPDLSSPLSQVDNGEDHLDDDTETPNDKEDTPDTLAPDEQTPLLNDPFTTDDPTKPSSNSWRTIPSRISSTFVGAVKVIVKVVISPFTYVIACFFDDSGVFSPLLPFFTIARVVRGRPSSKRRKLSKAAYTSEKDKPTRGKRRQASVTPAASAPETDREEYLEKQQDSPSRHTRSRSRPDIDASVDGDQQINRRSIRIRLNDSADTLKHRRRQLSSEITSKNPSGTPPTHEEAAEIVAQSLKSPSSPARTGSLTRFPKAPLPPRPLVPRRQPSYSKIPASLAFLGGGAGPHAKTLILDLDETLIHSHSKGGRFATGHMVEVKLQHSLGHGGVMIGPQVPILYYVHKRPFCDEFLRKVSKWYNLVVFTASVQEYADPVIDWLELEKKYFAARYYRQHCTYRTGAYIKDISQVEPDLSKVMIIDNSPLCYAFHEDNAMPIEGWISDPTDRDLMHLIPALEGLQYVTDVRALLALRRGQEKLEAS